MKKTALGILSLLGSGAYTANAQTSNAVSVNIRFHPVFTIIHQKTEPADTDHKTASDTLMNYLEVNSTTCFQLTEHSADQSDDTLLTSRQTPIKGLMIENINVAVDPKRSKNKIYTLTPL